MSIFLTLKRILRRLDDEGREHPLALVFVYLIFTFFVLFQSEFFALGYLPFQRTAYVTYAYRTLLVAFLFFGPAAYLLPSPWRWRVWLAGWFCFLAATTFYIGVVVSARPAIQAGHDRAEALSLGIRRTLRGEFPYSKLTESGNPISPLTASFLLALPAELTMRRPEVMSIFYLWLAVFVLAWQWERKKAPIPLSVLASFLLLNPVIINELIWGGDLLWCAVMLLIATLALDDDRWLLSAIFAGITLCTRASFYLLAPLWCVYLFRFHRQHFRAYLLATLSVILILELPFVFWSPKVFFTFAPLGVSSNKFGLPFPVHDNAIADLFNIFLPAGRARTTVASAIVLIISALAGFRIVNIVHFFVAQAALIGLSFFFMGFFFGLDFLSWIILPLLGALASWSPEEAKIKSR